MKWIESSGGPLILIEKLLSYEWGGIEKSCNYNYNSDYDFACDVDDTSIVSLPNGKAIILADEPDRTTVTNLQDIGTVIVRWRWAPSEEFVKKAINNLKENYFNNSDTKIIKFYSKEIIIFDTSFFGIEVEDYLSFNLIPGEYVFQTINYSPYKNLCLLLHRLRLRNSTMEKSA